MTKSVDNAIRVDLLPLIAHVSVAAWRLISAGEVGRIGGGEVELQPQPLPPVERVEIEAAIMAHRIAQLAIESEIQGRPASDMIRSMIDDWCGTPPWPRLWPRPVPIDGPVPGPRPNEVSDERLAQAGRIVGALVLSSIGSRLGTSELSAAMLVGAEQLANAAVSG